MINAVGAAVQTRWKLLLFRDNVIIDTYPITALETSIGRELDNNIPLDDLKVSRYHARLMQRGELLMLEDLDSANGTFINDQPIVEPTALQSGDAIQIGPFTLKLQSELLPVQLQPAPPAGSRRRIWPVLLAAAVVLGMVILALLGVLAGKYLFYQTPTPTPVPPSPSAGANSARPVIVISQAPAANSQVPINQSISVQAIASDTAGIKRIELWVNGQRADYAESPLNQSAASMTSSFEWSARQPGGYTIEVRAYNDAGLMTAAPVAVISAVSEIETPTSIAALPGTPTPTITPLPPTATPTFTPSPLPTAVPPTPLPALLTVNVPLLNVRTGPGVDYPLAGQLAQGQQVEILGRAMEWWQIKFAAATGGTGWVVSNPAFGTAQNTENVPAAVIPLRPTAAVVAAVTATATATVTPTPTAAPAVAAANVIRAPDGKTLLLVENRSLANLPARLTLSGGKSVGGGKEIDPAPNSRVEFTLEPDFYRALWSTPWKSFTRGADFTATPGKVILMWIVPEDGRTQTEIYDELVEGGATATPSPTPLPNTTPTTAASGPVAPAGKALLVLSNRSAANEFGVVTISGGTYGGGKQFVLNANTETQLEIDPANYRTIWHTPANGGMNAGKEFDAHAGDVIYGWIIPENRQAFMQFPGQPAIQINN